MLEVEWEDHRKPACFKKIKTIPVLAKDEDPTAFLQAWHLQTMADKQMVQLSFHEQRPNYMIEYL